MTDGKRKPEYLIVTDGDKRYWPDAILRHLQERQSGELLVLQAPSLPNRERQLQPQKLDPELFKMDLITPLPKPKPKYSDRLEKRLRKRK